MPVFLRASTFRIEREKKGFPIVLLQSNRDLATSQEICGMNIIKTIVTNGYIPIIPILIWNIIFTSKLPKAYDPNVFNSDIPLFIIAVENIFRSIVFILPILFQINIFSHIGRRGLYIYILGSVLYFISWLLLIFAPNSLWSGSIFGFTAPAYTPIIWLIGISLMADSYYFNISYAKWHYILPCVIFSIFHIMHSIFVYVRTN